MVSLRIVLPGTLLIFCLTVIGQPAVGIGTDAPDTQSILDIQSTDKGIYIPRMTTVQRDAISGLNATDEGLLIYNTTDAVFNYWDGTAWVEFPSLIDSDWYRSITTSPPTDINHDIYTFGNVGIGLNAPNYAFEVEQTASAAPLMEFRNLTSSLNNGASIRHVFTGNSTNGTISGISNEMSSITAGEVKGIYNDISGLAINSTGIGIETNILGTQPMALYGNKTTVQRSSNIGLSAVYGTHNTVSSGGTGTAVGVHNTVDDDFQAYGVENYLNIGNGAPSGVDAKVIGVYSELDGNDWYNDKLYGAYNIFYTDNVLEFSDTSTGVFNFHPAGNPGQGALIGMHNKTRFSNGSLDNFVGIQNDIDAGGIARTNFFGIKNNFLGSVDAIAAGVYNDWTLGGVNPNDEIYGVYSSIRTSCSSEIYGNYVGIVDNWLGNCSPGATGPIYGTYHTMNMNNHDSQNGVYSQIFSFTSDTVWGVNNTIYHDSSGTAIGTHNRIQGPNSGVKYGTINSITGGGGNAHYAVYNTLAGTTSGARYGTFNNMTSTTSGSVTGMLNQFSTNGTGIKYGTFNNFLSGDSGTKMGSYNNFNTNSSGIQYGLFNNFNSNNSQTKTAVYNDFNTSTAGDCYGIHTDIAATSTNSKYGQYVIVRSGTGGTVYGNYVNIDATSTSSKYAFRAEIPSGAGGFNYGYYASMGTTANHYAAYLSGRTYVSYRMGIGVTNPGYQLELSANSAAKPLSSAWTVTSDRRLKKDVKPYKTGLDLIRQIDPVWFTYNGEAGMPHETGIGTIAQDLEQVAPYMVSDWEYTDSISGETLTYLGVDYGPLQFALVNAVKEQQEMLEDKEARIRELEKMLSQLAGTVEDLKSLVTGKPVVLQSGN